MNRSRIIAVDIGNSAAKAMTGGWEQDSEVTPPRPIGRFAFGDGLWPHLLASAARRASDASGDGAATGDRWQWAVASVNRPALRLLRQYVAAEFPNDDWLELAHHDVPLEMGVRQPERVGIDRLLGACGAVWLTGLSTVITIDAGSAVTVDLVRDGRFEGGAILPGVGLQFAALAQGTDSLPSVADRDSMALEVPGRDTQAAMRCGVLCGIAGGVERLVREYWSAQRDESVPVVLTGGDAPLLQPLLPFAVERSDDLVLSVITRIAGGVRIE